HAVTAPAGGAGWDPPRMLAATGGGEPRVAMTDQSRYWALWDCRPTTTTFQVCGASSTVTPGAGAIDLVSFTSAAEPRWYVDTAGSGAGTHASVWAQKEGARTDIHASTDWTAGSGARISDGLFSATSPAVIVDASGNATAVWIQSSAT